MQGKKNLERRELSWRSGLFEKLGGGVEEIGPGTHVGVGGHVACFGLQEEEGESGSEKGERGKAFYLTLISKGGRTVKWWLWFS